LGQCAAKLNNIILDAKVKEGILKVINDDFGANVTRLETALKMTQVDVGHEVNIGEEIRMLKVVEKPKSNHLTPCPEDQA